MKHAMILGYVGVVLGLVGAVATWNMDLGPRWYPVLLTVLAIPQCWAGARIYERQSVKRWKAYIDSWIADGMPHNPPRHRAGVRRSSDANGTSRAPKSDP